MRTGNRSDNPSLGPRAVLYRGGPGAGKTGHLVHRVRQSLVQGLPPPSVLCLALDNAAAGSVQRRFLQAAATEPPHTMPQVLTYERVARQILAEATPGAAPHFLDTLTERLLVGRALEHTHARARYFRQVEVRSSPRFRDEVADFIAELKRHKLRPEDFREQILPGLPQTDALVDLAAVYERYQELLLQEGVYDLRGLLWLALEALKDPALGETWRERYALIVADDLQEATPLHLELIAALTGPRTELVGTYEPAQTIYGFRGALGDPRALLSSLLKRPLEDSPLEARAGALPRAIATVANRFSRMNDLDSAPAGVSALEGEVCYAAYRSREDEFSAIADELVELLEGGEYQPGELAVIARRSADAEAVAEHLVLRGLPVSEAEGQAQWQSRQALKDLLIACLWREQTAASPGARPARQQARGEALCRLASLTAESQERLRLPALCRDGNAWQADTPEYPALAQWHKKLEEAAELPLRERLTILAEHLLRCLPPEAGRRMAGPVAACLTQVNQSGEWLERLTGHPLTASEIETLLTQARLRPAFDLPGIAVLTAHDSRGRRFRRVYLACLEEDDFPAPPVVSRLLNPDTARALREKTRRVLHLPPEVTVFSGLGEAPEAALADEQRLYYTCLTRASESLYLSCHLEAGGVSLFPSPFLAASLPENFLLAPQAPDCPFRGWVPEEAGGREDHAGCPVSPCHRAGELRRLPPRPAGEGRKELPEQAPILGESADTLVLTPTHLKDYLRCPRRYFLTHLIRAGAEKDTDSQTYGQAVHAFLRALSAVPPSKRNPERAEALLTSELERFRERFSTPLAAEMYGQLATAGLAFFLQTHAAQAQTRSPETSLQFSLTDPEGRRHLFGGRIDVAETWEDGVAVVDYKTSNVESARNIRKGVPTDAGQRYLKHLEVQLPMYALAWEAETGALPVALCLQNFSVRYQCKRSCLLVSEGGEPEEALSREVLEQFRKALVHWATEIKGRADFAGQPPEEGCKPYLGECPFTDICDEADLLT